MRVSHGLLSLCSVSTAQCTMVSQKHSALRPFHPVKPAPCSTTVPRSCRMQQAKPRSHPIIHPKHIKALGIKSGLKARNKKRAYSHSPPQQLLKSISLPSLELLALVLAPKFSSYKLFIPLQLFTLPTLQRQSSPSQEGRHRHSSRSSSDPAPGRSAATIPSCAGAGALISLADEVIKIRPLLALR